jgi:hypothetical protein
MNVAWSRDTKCNPSFRGAAQDRFRARAFGASRNDALKIVTMN